MLIKKGKVRDIYEVNEDKLLLVASDRISAFDFILPTDIPNKGKMLTEMSAFWFKKTSSIINNHFISSDYGEIMRVLKGDCPGEFEGRSMLVKKARRINFECIVRGYLSGSGWEIYKRKGWVCGIKLPAGLLEAEKLPEPIFTPTTKADEGHDENVPFKKMCDVLGCQTAQIIKEKSIELYLFASKYMEERGIILADTKFEFGLIGGELSLIDEIFTPDSSRFWEKATYQKGKNPRSYDKQFVRDWLKSLDWDKKSPPPPLPADIVEKTAELYMKAMEVMKR